jgi:hypothetical protein
MFTRMLVLAAVLCIALPGRSTAQQASGFPRAVAPGGSAQLSAPTTPLPGPRVRPLFEQPTAPTLAPSRAGQRSSLADEGGQHTIVISTLALVLIVIIVVLLVVK